MYKELPREHELLSVVAEIAEIAGGREDAVILLSRKIFTRLFEVQNARCASWLRVWRSSPGVSACCCTVFRAFTPVLSGAVACWSAWAFPHQCMPVFQ